MKLAVYRWLEHNAGDLAVQQALEEAFGAGVGWTAIDVREEPHRALEIANGCDGLVVGGGTILGNLDTWLTRAQVIQNVRVPVGMFGTGIRDQGQSSIDEKFRRGVKRTIERAYPRGVRGPLSVELLRDMFDGSPLVTVMGDTALMLPVEQWRAPRPQLGVAINVRARKDGGDAATRQMLSAYLETAGRSYRDEVTYFSCHDEWDLRAGPELPKPIRPFEALDPFMRYLAKQRVVISERLHGAILAHRLGVPAVLIAYERKCWDYACSVGLRTSCVEPGDVNGLARAVDAAAADLSQASPAIETLAACGREMVRQFKERVDRQRRRRPSSIRCGQAVRPGDGRSVIGLLMIRDEDDMLVEALSNHSRFCSAIFVLDGSEGEVQRRTEKICAACPEVQEYWRDTETKLPLPLRDGARQFLLERARQSYGRGNWYAVLHGDELWSEDPRTHLDDVPDNCDAMAIRLYHFFPHTSERSTWDYAPGHSIEQLATWYMEPPVCENRIFWDSGHGDYQATRHSRTIPMGLKVWQSECVVKQYNYRTPGQATARAQQRKRDQWQERHYQHLLAGEDYFFRDTLEQETGRWASSVPEGTGRAVDSRKRPLNTWRHSGEGTGVRAVGIWRGD